jgi:hypothetical protein
MTARHVRIHGITRLACAAVASGAGCSSGGHSAGDPPDGGVPEPIARCAIASWLCVGRAAAGRDAPAPARR